MYTRLDGDVPARLIANSVSGMAEMLAPVMEARVDRYQRARGQEHLPPQHLVIFIDEQPDLAAGRKVREVLLVTGYANGQYLVEHV